MDYQLCYDLQTGEILEAEFQDYIENNVEVKSLEDNTKETN